MNVRTMTPTPALAGDMAERAAEHADDALHAVQAGVAGLRERVPEALSRATAQAEDLARRGLERVAEAGDAARWRIKDEPVKAVLLAAALGAGALLLVQWLSQRRRSSRHAAHLFH